jgi:hypothetical protein
MIAFNHQQLIEVLQNKLSVTELEIGPVQLGKPIDCIDIFEIVDLYVHRPEIKEFTFESSNFTFRERLEQLKERNGFIHLAGGLTCGIENLRITDFRFTKKYLEPVAGFTREEIIQFHGIPDAELVDDDLYGGFNYAIDSYILVYRNKKLNFHVEPGTGKLIEISTRNMDDSGLNQR